jgi:hypothetical protein
MKRALSGNSNMRMETSPARQDPLPHHVVGLSRVKRGGVPDAPVDLTMMSKIKKEEQCHKPPHVSPFGKLNTRKAATDTLQRESPGLAVRGSRSWGFWALMREQSLARRL